MKQIFSFRIDEATSKRLYALAQESQRSRGNVIRLLINMANAQEGLLTLSKEAHSFPPEKIERKSQQKEFFSEVQG